MQALAERLGDALTGTVLEGVEPLGFSALKTVVPAPESLIGHTVERVDRRAKYLILDFGDAGRILLHLSQAGRLDLEDPPKKTRAKGSVVRLRFADAPAVLVREYGHERKAAWWVLAPGDDGPLERLGPEPDSDEFAELILRGDDGRRVHTLLRDQRTVSGVGRGYADDALWRAQLSPYASLKSLDDDARARLLDAVRDVMRDGLDARAGAHRRLVAAEAGRALRGARPLRVTVPALRRDPATGELRVARGHLLPALPDRRQGARRPPHVPPGQVAARSANISEFVYIVRVTSRCSLAGLPAAGAGAALERADDLRRDPAAVEAAGLGDDELAVDEARVHAPGVERDVVGDRANAGLGVAYAQAASVSTRSPPRTVK